MAVLAEMRSSATRFAKILSLILALLVFAVVSVSTISGFLLYQTLHRAPSSDSINFDVMMGHPTKFSFPLADGSMRAGWFFPGLRGAPTVVVCHGYGSERADVLTLVTSLQEHQFNVFLFDLSGHNSKAGLRTLGYRETAELRSAIQALAGRDDVDARHFGIWGTDIGGYAALEMAASDPRIGALVVDDAYDAPPDMLRYEIKKTGLTAIPLVLRVSQFGFQMLNYSHRHEPPVSSRLSHTAGIPKLFVESEDRTALANQTLQLFERAPGPKRLMSEPVSYRDMSDDQRRAYESQVLSFFLQTIPPSTQ